MKKSMKDAAKQYLERPTLSDEAYEHLLKTVDEFDSEVTKSEDSIGFLWGMIASVFLVGLLSFMLGKQFYQADNSIDLIVAEVVKNHGKLKPLETKGANFTSVTRYFDQLEFLPKLSELPSANVLLGSSLLGGRYCSIQGYTAAQLRMKNKSGGFTTLFQTQDSEDFTMIPNIDLGLEPVKHYKNGYQVSLWRESGLLMVLVEPAVSEAL